MGQKFHKFKKHAGCFSHIMVGVRETVPPKIVLNIWILVNYYTFRIHRAGTVAIFLCAKVGNIQ